MNSNMNEYECDVDTLVCVHMMWRSRIVTWMLVLSCPAGKEGLSVKPESLEQTASYLVGQDKQESSRSLSSTLDWAMKDIFARCSKKTAVQVCAELWLHNYAVKRNCHEYLKYSILPFSGEDQ
jgi:hypothetical protein